VKPDDPPERIIVQHRHVAILVDAHRYAEELVCIGDITPEGEGVIVCVHVIADKTHVFRLPLFRQVSPLVGETATFSASARLAGNPWPAGQLVWRMVWLGSPDHERAKRQWERLFAALAVDDREDIFARFVKEELAIWSSRGTSEVSRSRER
jgi:hypothetical protein